MHSFLFVAQLSKTHGEINSVGEKVCFCLYVGSIFVVLSSKLLCMQLRENTMGYTLRTCLDKGNG